MKLHLRSSLLSLIHVKMCKEKGWVDWFRVGGVIAAAFFFLKTNQKKKTTVKIFDIYTEESEYIQAAKRIGEEVDPCPLNEVRLALLIRSPSPHNLCDPLFISHSSVPSCLTGGRAVLQGYMRGRSQTRHWLHLLQHLREQAVNIEKR